MLQKIKAMSAYMEKLHSPSLNRYKQNLIYNKIVDLYSLDDDEFGKDGYDLPYTTYTGIVNI